MKVFIMWSGAKSKAVAEQLYEFLQTVIQRPDYFISTEDIPTGYLWDNVLSDELETAHFGIACLTQDNLDSKWIHFESGAISKMTEDSKVVPYLIGIDPSDVTGPLTKYQATVADEQGTRALVISINNMQDDSDMTPESTAEKVFDQFWPDLQEVIESCATTETKQEVSSRSEDDMLREVLNRLRNLERGQPAKVGTTMPVADRADELASYVTHSLKGKSILWVDDNPDRILDLKAVTAGAGASSQHVLTTARAMDLLNMKQIGFDLIITKMQIDGDMRAGIKLIEFVKAMDTEIPIIVFGRQTVERLEEIREFGVQVIGNSKRLLRVISRILG